MRLVTRVCVGPVLSQHYFIEQLVKACSQIPGRHNPDGNRRVHAHVPLRHRSKDPLKGDQILSKGVRGILLPPLSKRTNDDGIVGVGLMEGRGPTRGPQLWLEDPG